MIGCLPFILMITSWPWDLAWTSGMPHFTIDRHHPARYESLKVESPCHISTFACHLTDEWSLSTRRGAHRLPPSTGIILLDYGLPSVSPKSHVYVLQVWMIIASKWISKLTRLWPTSSHAHGLQVYLHTRSITPSKGISKRARSKSRIASPSSLDHNLQVYLLICSITASKCISKFARSCVGSVSLSSHDCHFQVHLELLSHTACSQSRYIVCRWVAV